MIKRDYCGIAKHEMWNYEIHVLTHMFASSFREKINIVSKICVQIYTFPNEPIATIDTPGSFL